MQRAVNILEELLKETTPDKYMTSEACMAARSILLEAIRRLNTSSPKDYFNKQKDLLDE